MQAHEVDHREGRVVRRLAIDVVMVGVWQPRRQDYAPLGVPNCWEALELFARAGCAP